MYISAMIDKRYLLTWFFLPVRGKILVSARTEGIESLYFACLDFT